MFSRPSSRGTGLGPLPAMRLGLVSHVLGDEWVRRLTVNVILSCCKRKADTRVLPRRSQNAYRAYRELGCRREDHQMTDRRAGPPCLWIVGLKMVKEVRGRDRQSRWLIDILRCALDIHAV